MFEDLKNNIDFFIRKKTKFSRKNFVEKNKKLIERNELENLYTYEVLDKYFSKTPRDFANILDIGSKNWFYAKGEHSFFRTFCKEFLLNGVELDAHRVYLNLFSRYEVAKFYTKDLKNTVYIDDNLLNISQKYDYICWFLPLVAIEPHIFWGLPKKFFYPKKLLNHAFSLLNKNGEMLIINQGEVEAKIQEDLLNELNIQYKKLGEITSKNFQYQNKRYGFLIKK